VEVNLVVVAPVLDQTQVGEARRASARLAAAGHMSETRSADLAIIVTELATNLVKHAGGGRILLRALDPSPDGPGIEVLSLDKGPGMENVQACLQDGFSTAGSPGNGLGAIRRLASEFDLFSRAGLGTIAVARVLVQSEPRGGTGVKTHGFRYGAVTVPVQGETQCGDAYRVQALGARCSVLVVDGLGHGPLAAEASRVAVEVFSKRPDEEPAAAISAIHDALRSTRGAAVAIARIDPAAGTVRFCGLGNIAAAVADAGGTRRMVSHNGTAGQGSPRFKEFVYPWSPAATLVMHSDGLMSRWAIEAYQGILSRHPSLIAGALYRDFERGRDDTTVVVVQGLRA
jgi:anti-sigma regulatory factor (Ser/Thr protein kinase)